MTVFTETEIKDLLKREEGQFLEFKSLWDRESGALKSLSRRTVRDIIAEYIAAFANADGGTLVLGVEDDGTPSGHNYTEEALSGFIEVPVSRLRPSVNIRSQRMMVEGHELIIMDVPMSSDAIMVNGNGFPYRAGDQVIREPQEVINGRKQAYRRIGYEQRICPDATTDDLDLDLALRFLAHSTWKGRPVEEILAAYGLIHWKTGHMAVTNAALLLFGKRPYTRWHPRAGVRFFRVNGSERKYGKDRNVVQLPRLEPPLAVMIEEAYHMAAGQIRKSEKLHSLFFREMPEYPTFAWQEALVNAVAHRDYNDQGREIEVTFFENRMEILSPGDLTPPVTLEALQRRMSIHASRNPLLVRVLADAGIMREEGEGIPRIFEEMEESLLNPPMFDAKGTAFIITLLNEPVFSGIVTEWKAIVDRLSLSINQKRALLAYQDGFTNEDYRKLNDLDRDQAYREITEMVDKGILLPPGSAGRGAFYQVSPDLKETKSWLAERMPKLREFFQDHQIMKNADYRRIFQVSRIKAFRELSRMVESGILDRQGERKGTSYKVGSWFREPQN